MTRAQKTYLKVFSCKSHFIKQSGFKFELFRQGEKKRLKEVSQKE